MQEEELILAVKTGSERAYKQLYELWVSRLYRFVFQYLKSEEATDDVVQETFLRIWTNRELMMWCRKLFFVSGPIGNT